MAGRRRGITTRSARTPVVTMTLRPIAMTDAMTGTAHLVTDESVVAGRRAGGRYDAVCGAQVLAASLTMPERDQCQSCTGEAR